MVFITQDIIQITTDCLLFWITAITFPNYIVGGITCLLWHHVQILLIAFLIKKRYQNLNTTEVKHYTVTCFQWTMTKVKFGSLLLLFQAILLILFVVFVDYGEEGTERQAKKARGYRRKFPGLIHYFICYLYGRPELIRN